MYSTSHLESVRVMVGKSQRKSSVVHHMTDSHVRGIGRGHMIRHMKGRSHDKKKKMGTRTLQLDYNLSWPMLI